MAQLAPSDSDSRVSAGPGRSDDRANDHLPKARVRRRAVEVAGVAGGVAAVMLVLELTKQWVHPDISAWESHLTTVVFSGIVAALAGCVLLRRRDVLHDRVVAEAIECRRVAEDNAHANALLLATLESNRDGVLVADLDGTILTFNRQFLDMWHMPEFVLHGPTRQMMRHAKEQLSNPDALTVSVARLRTDIESESTDVLAFKNGRTVELFTAPLRLDGVVVGRVWRCRDVTAHRQAQQHIQMLAHTIRSVVECVVVTDMTDRIIFVNQAFLDTYGFEESDLIGHPIAVVRSSKNRQEVALEIFPATLQGGWRGELWNRRKDGTDFEIFLSTSIVRDQHGAPVALVGVSRDVTEQKRTEDALNRGRESERIVTLATGIAREVNNLLQTVLGSVALALDDVPADSPARSPLQLVVHASERAATLTAQLLAYADRGTLRRFAAFDLNHEIRERAASLRALVPPATTLDLDLASGSALIRADRQQIQQVLLSLVTNAAEAMANQPGRVRVCTRLEDVDASDPSPWVAGDRPAPGRYVCLSVEDQGVGMDAATISRIFDPFFSTKFLGRGMGLPAVLGVAHSARGAVAVDSTPGIGTRVTVAFPFDPADENCDGT